MPEQHIQLLTSLGLPKEQIDALEALTPDTMKEWKPDELVTTLQGNMKNTLSNDATFLASIPEDKINKDILKKYESGQYARFQNELIEVATKKLGLDDKEVLTADDRKSIKLMTEKIAQAYAVKSGNVDGLKKMQQEKAEALQQLETLKTETAANLTKELEKVTGLHTGKLIKTLTKVELQGLEGVDFPVDVKFISEPVLSLMNAKFNIVLDANDNLDIKQKDNVALDVIDKAGKKVTFNQALKELVLENKLGVPVKEDPANPGGKKKIIINSGGGDGGGDVVELPDYIKNKIVPDKQQ